MNRRAPADGMRAVTSGPEPAAAARALKPPREVALRVCVRRVLVGGEPRDRFASRYRRLVDDGARVCLLPESLGGNGESLPRWRRFCEALREIGSVAGSPALCIHSHQLPLESYRAEADAALGPGPRFVYLDGLQMQGSGLAGKRSSANWAAIWRSRNEENPLLPVYGGFVRSSCPLLADEAAVDVLPVSGLQVPAGAAILPVHVDLAGYADAAGNVDRRRLGTELQALLAAAECLFDRDDWPTRAQRIDAASNRRLAFIVSGIGDLVMLQDADPASLSCLRTQDELVAWISRQLRDASASEAAARGALPSLDGYSALGRWFEGGHGEAWQACFDAARRRAAIRNRNLLSMSPYAVLPRSGKVDPRFTDLLPLIRHADTWSFAGRPRFSGWNSNEVSNFHERARAIIQASQAATLVAAGV
ncbi:MAG: hypothetical protein OEV41_05920 [Gammaproteobacteria bacterium]|nr:hypothetical protein [Gammaproteobacteria bacterium]MDH5345417.1 hypothetical protein [Gammaproteobacteria bacterium]